MTTTAEKIRQAVDERNRQTADVIADYDLAVAEGDTDKIQVHSMMLLIAVGLADPVRECLNRMGHIVKFLDTIETT